MLLSLESPLALFHTASSLHRVLLLTDSLTSQRQEDTHSAKKCVGKSQVGCHGHCIIQANKWKKFPTTFFFFVPGGGLKSVFWDNAFGKALKTLYLIFTVCCLTSFTRSPTFLPLLQPQWTKITCLRQDLYNSGHFFVPRINFWSTEKTYDCNVLFGDAEWFNLENEMKIRGEGM